MCLVQYLKLDNKSNNLVFALFSQKVTSSLGIIGDWTEFLGLAGLEPVAVWRYSRC